MDRFILPFLIYGVTCYFLGVSLSQKVYSTFFLVVKKVLSILKHLKTIILERGDAIFVFFAICVALS